MTALTDAMLNRAGLLTGIETAGFRAAMSATAGRHPSSLPMDERTSLDPLRREAFERGARIAGHWRMLRIRDRSPRIPTTTAFERREANRAAKSAGFESLIEAISTECGFPDAHSRIAHEIACRTQPGEIQHLRRDVIEFYHAEGPNGTLSPTHATSITCGGRTWRSVEAVYQSHKHSDAEIRELVRCAPDALSAKAASRSFPITVLAMRDPFGPARREAMARGHLLRARHDRDFRDVLLGTGDRPIVEIAPDGEPVDSRWGAFGTTVTRGWNMQGRILVQVRNAVYAGLVPFLG